MSAPNRLPRPGEIVIRRAASTAACLIPHELGLYIGRRTFNSAHTGGTPYVCSEVWWFDRPAPNGDTVSTIQCGVEGRSKWLGRLGCRNEHQQDS